MSKEKTHCRLTMRFLFATQVCKPGSVLTAIYLVPQSLTGSSRLLEAVGQTYCFSTALLRIEFTAPPCSHEAGGLLPHLFTLTVPADGSAGCGGISLLHLSWGRPRQALPVILALWSPDFPHLDAFAVQPRLSDLVANHFTARKRPCQISFKKASAGGLTLLGQMNKIIKVD